jgi:DNA replication and repair protein RecF
VHVEWLALEGFRAYETLHIELAAGTNVFVGPNGAGKTSLLEAVNYLGYLRSFRGSSDAALVRVGSDSAVIRGEVDDSVSRHLVEIELSATDRRRVRLDGKRPRRNSDLAAVVPSVTFSPDDLALVKGGPALRRELIDDLSRILRPAAAADQDDYAKALRQRNALLRSDRYGGIEDELAAFDAAMAGAGARIYLERQRLLLEMAPYLQGAYATISGDDVVLTCEYSAKWIDNGSADETSVGSHLLGEFESRRRVDLERRVTTSGPHRDDISLVIGGRSSRDQASQGEQRSVVLAVKLAAFDLLVDGTDRRPIMLLDDVLSELDPARAAAVRSRLPGSQALVTTAREEDAAILDGAVWDVAGKVERR